MAHDDTTKETALAQIAASGVLSGQCWEHGKTGTVYLIVAVGLNEPDLEPLVHYRKADDAHAIVWTRQLHVFCGKVLDGAAFASRFTKCGTRLMR
jgi:hypothetical protein